MEWLAIVLSVCVITCSVFCEDEELSDDRTTLVWKPTDNNTITVKAADGYQIEVEVSQFDVDGESEDFVTIKSVNDDDEESDALMFTYTVSGKPSYLYNNNKVKADYSGNNESNTFSIQFKRVGEATTTTPEPSSTSSTEAMPTAAPSVATTLSVFLAGRAADDFGTDEINSLRDSIASMGEQYCNVQNCPLNGSITPNNAKIESLERCPMLWDNYENCVNLTFALPIIKLEEQETNAVWDGYQLNRDHLKIMWDTYAETHINKLGLYLYTEPNVNKIFQNRLVISCLVIVGLVLLILILRHIVGRINKRRRKLSDTVSIMGHHTPNRNSQLSLTPHFLQELPPLFSNDFPLYTEQRNQKNFADFDNGYTDDIETSAPPISPKKLNLNSNNPHELEDAEA